MESPEFPKFKFLTWSRIGIQSTVLEQSEQSTLLAPVRERTMIERKMHRIRFSSRISRYFFFEALIPFVCLLLMAQSLHVTVVQDRR